MPTFGNYRLSRLHPHQVRTWVAKQVAGPHAASSVRQHIAVLRSCLKAAQIDGHLETLPMLGVKLPPRMPGLGSGHGVRLTFRVEGERFMWSIEAPVGPA